MDQSIVDTYNNESDALIAQYESKTFEEVHSFAVQFIPPTVSLVLDVGSGSGRDAAWFASKGHRVFAIDPARQLLHKAQQRHPWHNILWMEDSLPNLDKTKALCLNFDLIWLSAVWMHLPISDREEAFSNLGSMMSENAKIMISLRHGEHTNGRTMYRVSIDELERFSAQHGLEILRTENVTDSYKRDRVWWQTVMIGRSMDQQNN